MGLGEQTWAEDCCWLVAGRQLEETIVRSSTSQKAPGGNVVCLRSKVPLSGAQVEGSPSRVLGAGRLSSPHQTLLPTSTGTRGNPIKVNPCTPYMAATFSHLSEPCTPVCSSLLPLPPKQARAPQSATALPPLAWARDRHLSVTHMRRWAQNQN